MRRHERFFASVSVENVIYVIYTLTLRTWKHSFLVPKDVRWSTGLRQVRASCTVIPKSGSSKNWQCVLKARDVSMKTFVYWGDHIGAASPIPMVVAASPPPVVVATNVFFNSKLPLSSSKASPW